MKKSRFTETQIVKILKGVDLPGFFVPFKIGL